MDNRVKTKIDNNYLSFVDDEVRDLLLLRHVYKFNIKEIAEIIDSSTISVSIKLFGSKKKLLRCVRLCANEPKLSWNEALSILREQNQEPLQESFFTELNEKLQSQPSPSAGGQCEKSDYISFFQPYKIATACLTVAIVSGTIYTLQIDRDRRSVSEQKKQISIELAQANMKNNKLTAELAKYESVAYRSGTNFTIEVDIPAWIDAIHYRDREIRNTAIEKLAAQGNLAVPQLIKVLDDDSKSKIHYFCLEALGKMGPGARGAVPVLIKNLTTTGDDRDVSWKSAEVLGSIGAEANEAVPALIHALESGDVLLREKIAWALGVIGVGTDDVTSVLKRLSKSDDNENVRAQATSALEEIERNK